MVNALGSRCAADRALTSLSSKDLIELRLRQPVALLEVVLTRAAMILDLVVTTANVMARQAVPPMTLTAALVAGKLFQRLD